MLRVAQRSHPAFLLVLHHPVRCAKLRATLNVLHIARTTITIADALTAGLIVASMISIGTIALDTATNIGHPTLIARTIATTEAASTGVYSTRIEMVHPKSGGRSAATWTGCDQRTTGHICQKIGHGRRATVKSLTAV
jgi:hypothetical protein